MRRSSRFLMSFRAKRGIYLPRREARVVLRLHTGKRQPRSLRRGHELAEPAKVGASERNQVRLCIAVPGKSAGALRILRQHRGRDRPRKANQGLEAREEA